MKSIVHDEYEENDDIDELFNTQQPPMSKL